jgi:hypothetical protein
VPGYGGALRCPDHRSPNGSEERAKPIPASPE